MTDISLPAAWPALDDFSTIQSFFQLPFQSIERIQAISEPEQSRWIYKVSSTAGQWYALKMYSIPSTTTQDLQAQAMLCTYLAQHGMSVPARLYGSNNCSYIQLLWEEQEVYAIMEAWLPGREPEQMNACLIQQAGEWLGRMHLLASQTDTVFNFNSYSPWSLFNEDEEMKQEAKQLHAALLDSSADTSLRESLFQLYEEKRMQLKQCWPSLPSGAVQGDFSLNNLLINEQYQLEGIIDFNLAGNDTFVSHLSGEAAFLAYAADREDGPDEQISDLYVQRFLAGYMKYRSLTAQELHALNHLIGLRRAFACYQVDAMYDLLDTGQIDAINAQMSAMITWMQQNDVALNKQ
ncbi:phosphotransferase enzyme family protein [Paenibacillus sp. 481]|uniref:phosphotransferase enzyme family protein n=1 Tax=Paenibacillus sp. 481 TaxID=2835869 RepID=UPI001E36AB49|nr:phosphotransferase [Paenibacillus sp. 481]UHA75048.1 phosphotransferase [Paenibacillus sp. 481]